MGYRTDGLLSEGLRSVTLLLAEDSRRVLGTVPVGAVAFEGALL